MNPCHTRWAVPIDSIKLQDQDRCEMCGNLKQDNSVGLSTVQLASGSMWLVRLAERMMWGGHTAKGIGSVAMVISARLLNRDASIMQIAAATGLTKPGVQHAIDRAKIIMPDVYASLWSSSK